MHIQDIKKRLPLIIAVVCGIFAIVLLSLYLNRRESAMVEQMQRAQEEARAKEEETKKAQLAAQQQAAKAAQKMGVVVVALKEIPAQTPLTTADLFVKEIPAQEIKPDAVVALEQAAGQISGVAFAKGEQILKAKLLSPSQVAKSLAEVTPEGKRAVTVTADAASNIALIQPGNYVDVFAIVSPPKNEGSKKKTEQLFNISQNMKVLAVGDRVIGSALVKDKGVAAGTRGLITLAATPQEAILLSFVQEHGKIRLILRAPEDANVETVPPADWDTLLRYLSASDTKVEEGKETGQVVEIYRGLEKEVIPLREK